MADPNLYYRFDAETSWTTSVAGDGWRWPTTSGVHIIELSFAGRKKTDGTLPTRMQVKVAGSDSATYGLRELVLKGRTMRKEKP